MARENNGVNSCRWLQKRHFSIPLSITSLRLRKNMLIDKQNKNRILSSLSLSSFSTMNSFFLSDGSTRGGLDIHKI